MFGLGLQWGQFVLLVLTTACLSNPDRGHQLEGAALESDVPSGFRVGRTVTKSDCVCTVMAKKALTIRKRKWSVFFTAEEWVWSINST